MWWILALRVLILARLLLDHLLLSWKLPLLRIPKSPTLYLEGRSLGGTSQLAKVTGAMSGPTSSCGLLKRERRTPNAIIATECLCTLVQRQH